MDKIKNKVNKINNIINLGVSTLAIHNNSISTGDNYSSFTDDLEFFESIGINYIEILHEYPNNNNNIDNIDNNIDNTSFDLFDLNNNYSFKYAVHSPISDVNIASRNSAIRNASINEIKSSIDLANAIDSNIVVVHPGTIPFIARFDIDNLINNTKKSIIDCAEYAKDSGVIIAVENMPNMDMFLYKDIFELNGLINDLRMMSNDFESSPIAMTMDIAHAHSNGFNINDCYFDSVKHIHLSDNDGLIDSHDSLGTGNIDFKATIDLFKNKWYNGIYTLELNNKEDILRSINYLYNIL
ncbi:MAG: sugar phosphate isomerase/epimerase family protein [Methanobacteriaceae archaeon]